MRLRRSASWSDPRVKPPRGAARLDLGHPLARGIVGAWIDAESVVEDYGPRANTATRVGTTLPAVRGGPGSPAHFYDGASSRLLTIRSKTDDLVLAMTVLQGIRPQGSLISHRNTIYRGAASTQLGIIVFADGHWEAQDGGGSTTSGFTLTLNADFSIAYTLTGAGGTLAMYQNGRPGATVGSRTASTQNQDLTIGADVSNGRYWNGLIYYTYLYNRALSGAELAWLHAEPYAIFVPVARRRVVFEQQIVTRDGSLPVDWRGLETLLRNAPISVAWKGTAVRDGSLPLDTTGTARRDALLPIDLPGVEATDLLHRWLVLVRAESPLTHAWNVLKAAESFPLTHQWNVRQVAAGLPHRWNVIGDILTPFGVDPTTGEPLPATGGAAAPGDIQQPVATTDKTP